MTATRPEVRDCEELYVYSEEDIAAIASDMFVDLRDIPDMNDQQAAAAVEIAFERLTDEFYSA